MTVDDVLSAAGVHEDDVTSAHVEAVLGSWEWRHYGDGWADWLAARCEDGLPAFVYFNNDAGGHAPRDAARLRGRLAKLVGGDGGKLA